MSKLKDLTGQTFGYLTVIKRAENTKDGKPKWLCRCVCGRLKKVAGSDLKKKKHSTRSCGCMKGLLIGRATTTHGLSHHPIWAVWHSLRQRCLNPHAQAYKNYGGRGITVCERWRESFQNFLDDMGPSYKHGLQLDRIDNNKGYSPENCHWVTSKENSRNKRTNRVVPFYGKTISELSEESGIGVTTLCYRLGHNWPPELLLTKPNVRNVCTTSGIVVRGTASPSTTPRQKK